MGQLGCELGLFHTPPIECSIVNMRALYRSHYTCAVSVTAITASLLWSATAIGAVDVDAIYRLLGDRIASNRTRFYVYRDADSGLNHGFPSGLFGTFAKVHLDAACVDDPGSPSGCSSDPNRIDRARGTVLKLSFDPLVSGEFAGVTFEEPERFGVLQSGAGYDLRGATAVAFEARSPTSSSMQFGVGGCVTPFVLIPPGFTSFSFPIASLVRPPGTSAACPPSLDDQHLLFTVVTNDVHAASGATVLVDDVRFEPVPSSRGMETSFPLGTETFGVVPLATPASGRVPIPPDQVLRNVTTIYESALVLYALVRRGDAQDLIDARKIAEAFDYALHNDNHGDPLPASVGAGLHNAYESGDLALVNGQGPGAGRQGDVRLSGFSVDSTLCGPSKFCLVLDGATGGNNAFALLALLATYDRLGDTRYLDDARDIGRWLIAQLTDATGTGFGGYYVGYPDEGVVPKVVIQGKSIENNADIFAALNALAIVERRLGNTTEADLWTAAAVVAGDFVMNLFDPTSGCFHAGTVPVGTPVLPGIAPTGAVRGGDVVNTFPFVDSNTFVMLALAPTSRYRNAIDWRRPVQCMLDRFAQTVSAAGQSWSGFDIVETPTAGPNGVAWEFTGQAVAVMRLADALNSETALEDDATAVLAQIANAQVAAPYGDGEGLPASTLQGGDSLLPLEQCLSTPFQCIPERVGLAATTWGLFAARDLNPLAPLCEVESTFDSIRCRLAELIRAVDRSTDLGRLRGSLAKALDRARTRTGRAQQASVAGQRRQTGNLLRAAARDLQHFDHRLESRAAVRVVPASTRSALVAQADPIQVDLLHLRDQEMRRLRRLRARRAG